MNRNDQTRLMLFAVAAVLAGWTPAATAQDAVWGRTRSGMTVAEVRQLAPTAQATEGAEPTEEGWVERLHARVHDGPWEQEVRFSFKDGRLVGAVVSMGEPFQLAPINDEIADAILDSMTASRGPPVRCADTSDQFRSCFWLKDGRFTGYLKRPPPNSAVVLFLFPERPGDRDLLTGKPTDRAVTGKR